MLRFLSPAHIGSLPNQIQYPLLKDYLGQKVLYSGREAHSYFYHQSTKFVIARGEVESDLAGQRFEKIVSSFSGGATSIALTDKGELYYRCSGGSFSLYCQERVVDIGESLIILTASGEVYAVNEQANSFQLVLLEIPAVVSKIYCAHMSDHYITTDGEVYTWSCKINESVIKLQLPLVNERVVSVVTGNMCRLFLTDRGRIYMLMGRDSEVISPACNDYILSATFYRNNVIVTTDVGKLYSLVFIDPYGYTKQSNVGVFVCHEVPGCVVKVLDVSSESRDSFFCTVVTSTCKLYQVSISEKPISTVKASLTLGGVKSCFSSGNNTITVLLTTDGKLYIRNNNTKDAMFRRYSLPFKVIETAFTFGDDSLLLVSSDHKVYGRTVRKIFGFGYD